MVTHRLHLAQRASFPLLYLDIGSLHLREAGLSDEDAI